MGILSYLIDAILLDFMYLGIFRDLKKLKGMYEALWIIIGTTLLSICTNMVI